MRSLRVGIIGLGVGQQHLEAYLHDARCNVVSVCDFSSEKCATVQEKYGVDKLTQRATDILTNPEIDVVSIASYDDDHFAQAIQAIQAGKHVFVEKPLCRSLEELQALKTALRQNSGVKLASNLVLREAPAYKWVRAAITEGLLGQIYAFDGDYLYGRLSKITNGWRKDVAQYSVMLGGGIHLVDLMLLLTGEIPQTVTAVGNRISTAASDFAYMDFVAATFQFPSGLVGRITANFGCVHRHQHVLRIFGTDGTFLYDDQGPRYHFSRDPGLTAAQMTLATLPPSKGALIKDFLQDILTDKNVEKEIQHEFNVISICLAADWAVTSHQTVEIVYV